MPTKRAVDGGDSGYQALARGVVTPKDDNKIILFVTFDKPDYIMVQFPKWYYPL